MALEICSGWSVNTPSFTHVGGGRGRVLAGRWSFQRYVEVKQSLDLMHIRHALGSQHIQTQHHHHLLSTAFNLHPAHDTCSTCHTTYGHTWSIHPTQAIFLRFWGSSPVLSHSSEVSSEAMPNLYLPVKAVEVKHLVRPAWRTLSHPCSMFLDLLMVMNPTLACRKWGNFRVHNHHSFARPQGCYSPMN